jgi:alkylation response protein AidB-like acyl-CoA dehydrogenase
MTADLDLALDTVAAARRLSPEIIAAREEADQLRHLPPALADKLANAGLYRLYLPRNLGGLELPPASAFEVIEALSRADGSVGWCLMNANAVALGAAWLAPEVGQRLFGQPPNIQAAGSLRPQGRAWPEQGGYRLKGKWNFASGLMNANWLFCPAVIMDGDAPRISPAGAPAIRTMWVSASDATFIDNWSVMGMRATGSHDFAIDDLFVPQANSISIADASMNPGPLYRPRLFLTMAHVLFAANALGIARGSIETLIDMGSREATTLSTMLLRDRPFVQSRVAQAEAIVNAARCYVVDSLARLWTAVCADKADPSWEIAQTRLAVPHAVHEAVRAIDLLFHAAGTNAIYTANPLERQFRDIHVAVQHFAAFPIHFESAGKVLLGLRPSEAGW